MSSDETNRPFVDHGGRSSTEIQRELDYLYSKRTTSRHQDRNGETQLRSRDLIRSPKDGKARGRRDASRNEKEEYLLELKTK